MGPGPAGHAAADCHRARQPDPPRRTRRCSNDRAALPRRSTTTADLLQQARPDRRDMRPGGGQPRPAPHAGGLASDSTSARSASTPDEPFQVHDLLTARATSGSGSRNYVELDPTQCRRTSSTCAAHAAHASADFEYFAMSMHRPNGCRSSPARPHWYKDAIIYEVHVRAFADSNGDGIGDFRGLTQQARLPAGPRRHRHLAAAVLPVAAARRRLRHRRLHATSTRRTAPCATSKRFLREAHDRGLRVITELVINHTSDQHAWFQRARRAPPGSRRARLLRLERHAGQVPRTRASSSRTSSPRTGPGTRWPKPTTGTASTRTSPT